ncbi:SDR family NAD(P)-dependent oxidoreductase [Nocardia shimofusensis]|uniref:SDR family NAD(P)-dependent oxidoreductase n=1 Tax=Nocardia shimofusensis TaxID=228596 RepID=UPI00082F7E23|nr:SDR family NAD(P)-dependent oxidoreductase [Nocardia shimofusensis]
MTDKTVLITGAGGGLGGATAELFAGRGWQVLAADLRPPRPAPNLIPLALDVTDSASVAAASKAAEEHAPGGIDAVVTFAGMMFTGPLVEVAEEDMRRIFEVNVLGTYRVVKAAFPLILRARGRVITISSETGWQKALMLNGPYAMTKHAIEAYSDALRRELMFLDIPVSTVQPGPFRTTMVEGIRATFDKAKQNSTYFAELIGKVGAMAEKENASANDPQILAEVVWRAATTARPRRRYSVKADLSRSLMHRLPDGLLDPLLKKLLAPR